MGHNWKIGCLLTKVYRHILNMAGESPCNFVRHDDEHKMKLNESICTSLKILHTSRVGRYDITNDYTVDCI